MSQEFEYRFERVKVNGGFFGTDFMENYRETVEKFARDGWRFVQAFAPFTYGSAINADLIFERRVR